MADNDQWLHDADRLDIPGPRKVKRPRVQLDSEKFGQFAEATARFMGTAKFLVYMTVIVCSWVIWNLVAIYKLRFDPYPFILLNLFFSTQASYSAPLILLAQNRQEDRDRVSMAEDRRVAAQSRADMEFLAREVASIRMQMGELATRLFALGATRRVALPARGDRGLTGLPLTDPVRDERVVASGQRCVDKSA